MSDNLFPWLEPFRRVSGRVWKESVDWYGERLARLAEASGIKPWPHNALRHSFGSYHYAFHRNENLTASEMGNSPDVVFRHYRALVDREAGEAFWSILP